MNINIALNKTIDQSYTIHIKPLPTLTFEKKVAIITNPTVAGHHLNTLLSHIQAPVLRIITIPDGENHNDDSIRFQEQEVLRDDDQYFKLWCPEPGHGHRLPDRTV